MTHSSPWFQQGLGARIDAITVALDTFLAGEDPTASAVRNLARSLAEPAALYGYATISQAAHALETVHLDAIEDAVSDLISLLRQEASKTRQAMTTILIIGGEESFNATLCERLDFPSRNIVCADSAASAETALREYDVIFIVLNLFIPDIDARTLFQRLQETPRTASIPVLILAPEIPAEVRKDVELLDSDVITKTLPDPEILSTRINTRLRRSHETSQEARRDPTSGLLNRAAFRESFSAAVLRAERTGDPVCLALIGADNADSVLAPLETGPRDAVISRIGSLISQSLRSTDILARWTTTEFAVIFPGEDQLGGVQAIKKVIQSIRTTQFPELPPPASHITLSAGVALAPSDSTLEDAVGEADRFLFQAVTAGGNRVGSSQTPAPAHTEQVLLLVNDNLTCHVMQHLLERDGFSVTTLNDGNSPLSTVFKTGQFHLIVIDEGIRPHGGFEALKELRAMPRNRRTPIVMLIDKNAEESMVQALEFGANDYMMRPFSPFTFIRRMRRLLTGASQDQHPNVNGDVCRVLVIDEDSRFLLMAATALHQRRGFQPFLALGHTDGRTRFDKILPNVVLANAEMNQDNEGRFIRDLLKDCAGKDIRVILAASDPKPPFTGDALKAVFTTPINTLSLGKQIEDALRIAHSSHHPDNADKYLNAEMQRITRLVTSASED